MTTSTLANQLRRWAAGLYTTEAATELLLRALHGRFAQPGHPWIHTDDGWAWIEFDAITDDTTGVLSGGERRLLHLAAGLATGRPVDLADVITGLDRSHTQLVLAALAHAAGSHQHGELRRDPTTGNLELIEAGSLYPWPQHTAPPGAPLSTPGESPRPGKNPARRA